LRQFVLWVRAAASRTRCTADKRSPINRPMIAITTSNSMRVKARRKQVRGAVRSIGRASRVRGENSSHQIPSGAQPATLRIVQVSFCLGAKWAMRREQIQGPSVLLEGFRGSFLLGQRAAIEVVSLGKVCVELRRDAVACRSTVQVLMLQKGVREVHISPRAIGPKSQCGPVIPGGIRSAVGTL